MDNVVFDDNAFGTTLLVWLFDKLGMKVFEYEPETVADYLRRCNKNIKQRVIDRVNAAIGLYTSDLFWQDPVTFGIVCRSLNRRARPLKSEPDLDDIAWGMSEAALLVGDDDVVEGETPPTYSIAIDKYVRYLLQQAGIYDTPTSMTGISSPNIHTQFDDSQQLQSIQERSDMDRAVIDIQVQDKMTELLRQLSSLDVALAKDARKELQALLSTAR